MTAIERGGVMAQVEVTPAGTAYRVSPVMAIDSPEEMGLCEGDTVPELAEAVNVLLMKPQAPPDDEGGRAPRVRGGTPAGKS